MSTEEAALLATQFLKSTQPPSLPELKLFAELTEEHDFGWLFFWGPVDEHSLTKLIRQFSSLDLAQAKQFTDDILADKKVELTLHSHEQAEEFLSQAKSLGSLGNITTRWE